MAATVMRRCDRCKGTGEEPTPFWLRILTFGVYALIAEACLPERCRRFLGRGRTHLRGKPLG